MAESLPAKGNPKEAFVGNSISNEDEAPSVSPYTTRAVTISIGQSGAKYTVLQAIVDQYSGLRARLNRANVNAPIILREVDDDIGHTFIHYLFTGQYETLPLGDVPEEARVATEFKRSVLAYCAARLCGIEKLEELTREKIEELSKGLSIFNLQGITEEVFPKLPQKGDWFAEQMNKWIKAALVADDSLLSEKGFIDIIGRSAVFDRAVVKSLTEMYDEQKAKLSKSKALPKEDKEEEEDEEEEEVPVGSAKNPSPPAARDRPDSGRPNGIVTQGLHTYVKTQLPQNGIGTAGHDLDEAVANKANTEEYSPMPSEEPSESPFEARRSSVGRDENPTGKAADSDGEAAKPTKPKTKKKRNKGKKSDASGVRASHDDESQVGVGD